ncbi:single-stranded DNA-binding protein [Promicromonospora sp. MEB111]|uniref:single-stranded DNA-binding protein n=1 Tax=unclassified Promicromonospora TaxID=2647929 RepID=UPI00254B2287|nr:single-stranded DNA-binding protein [Promicromonospora sp. MEB111]
MNDVTVTVSGFAGNSPALHTGTGKPFAMFRVASTRRYVNDAGEWTDGATLWFTVKAWRTAAVNLVRSVRKGDPVVVTGRLEMDEWAGPDGEPRSGLVIAATGVGVDATRGKVEFSRLVHHEPMPGSPEEGGLPALPGDDGLVAARAGEPDPFGVDLPVPEGDEEDQGDGAGVGQRELVTA